LELGASFEATDVGWLMWEVYRDFCVLLYAATPTPRFNAPSGWQPQQAVGPS